MAQRGPNNADQEHASPTASPDDANPGDTNPSDTIRSDMAAETTLARGAPALSAGPRLDQLDPRNLIREAFAIDGIVEADCRSIFFDWAMGLSADLDQSAAIEGLLSAYADQPSDHPMRLVLLEGVGRRGSNGAPDGAAQAESAPRRRGGRQRVLDRASGGDSPKG